MRKLKDIRKNLNSNIDIKSHYDMGEVCVQGEKITKNTQEITIGGKDISLKTPRDIHIQKNKTRNFDSFWPKTLRFSSTLDISKTRKYILDFPSKKVLLLSGIMSIIIFYIAMTAIIVENRVTSGYDKILGLQEKTSSVSWVRQDINNARFDFIVSDIFFTPFKLFSSHTIDTWYHAIKWWRMLTKSLDTSLQVYEKTLSFFEKKPLEEIYFTQLFQNIHDDFIRIEDLLVSTLYHYKSISLPSDVEVWTKLRTGISKLEFVTAKLSSINNNFATFLDIFGHSGRRNYIVVFQNSDEIRPTGWFMWSMALVSVFRGKIQSFTPRDVYSLEWDLKRADFQRVPPPKGIDQLTSSFWLRDANYYINVKDSSEAIRFFVERSWQQIDGVIYINQNILLDMLKIVGGVSFEKINTQITSENFSEVISLLVESKIYKEWTQGTPKQVLFDFIKDFTQETLQQKQYASYLTTLIRHIESRDIMMYSFRKNENTLLKDLEIWGDIDYWQSLDFSYPVFTSLSWNKSDRYMDRSFTKEFSTVGACDIETNLTLISRHGFNEQKTSYMEKLIADYQVETPNILTIQWAGDNYQFVRVILPEMSEIEEQEGMEIRDYWKRKWVEFFLRTRPTETSTYTINYTLKNPECKTYTYSHYKQPGIPKYDIEITSQQRQDLFTWLEGDFFYSKR